MPRSKKSPDVGRSKSNLPDSRSIKRLLKLLGEKNVAAIQIGEFRVEFTRAPEPSTTPAPTVERSPFFAHPAPEPEKPANLIPGTPFTDDDTPIDAADLVLFPPTIDGSEVN